ncbi:MAG TPA: DUF1428 domain-containing protein [Telluria sp.]|nr:DUF1428 domain-containing protein [Telluria sp.]
MAYIDGFLTPVPRENIDAYRKMSETCGKIWREFGALRYRECMADDVKPGKWTSFPQAVDLKENEVVFFSWIEYNSRAERDEINEKVMKDPRIAEYMNPESMPFDGKRMMYGGFDVFIDM